MPSRSMADDEAWVRAHLYRDRRFSPPRVAPFKGAASLVQCPGCKAPVRALEVLDLRRTDAHPADGLCGGCLHRTHHDPESPHTYASLHQAAGMAWPHVRKLLARHVAHDLEREHWQAEEASGKPRHQWTPFRPAEARKHAHAAAGAKRRDLAGAPHEHGAVMKAAKVKMKEAKGA